MASTTTPRSSTATPTDRAGWSSSASPIPMSCTDCSTHRPIASTSASEALVDLTQELSTPRAGSPGASVRSDRSLIPQEHDSAMSTAGPASFASRHIGPRPADIEAMLGTLGYGSLDALMDDIVPEDIRLRRPLNLPPGQGERDVLRTMRGMAAQNQVFRSYIGMGYYGCFMPPVIQRNVLRIPGWYTAYTPY